MFRRRLVIRIVSWTPKPVDGEHMLTVTAIPTPVPSHWAPPPSFISFIQAKGRLEHSRDPGASLHQVFGWTRNAWCVCPLTKVTLTSSWDDNLQTKGEPWDAGKRNGGKVPKPERPSPSSSTRNLRPQGALDQASLPVDNFEPYWEWQHGTSLYSTTDN